MEFKLVVLLTLRLMLKIIYLLVCSRECYLKPLLMKFSMLLYRINFKVEFEYHKLMCTAEHMLFYASEKYPSEGSYMKFIAEVLLAPLWF